ncbi:hypothetical protein [Bacillus salacetis]|uniref:hypothetical protein n=1 Tax=Bacillus salacetis TaxID=2315464 RepID=UPI00144395FE|nr:hypothetical protein [Bacillus salacetis]
MTKRALENEIQNFINRGEKEENEIELVKVERLSDTALQIIFLIRTFRPVMGSTAF